MGAGDAIALELAKPDGSEPTIGRFQDLDGDLAKVIVGDGIVRCAIIGAYQPIPGQRVWLARFGRGTYLLGPAEAGSAIGQVVSAATAPVIDVEVPVGSGVQEKFGAPTGMSLSVGDYVVIDRFVPIIIAGPYAFAALPANAVPNAPSGAGGGRRSATFQAFATGSYQGGYWTNDVWDSVSNDGVAVYGSSIADTIPDSATIVSAELYLNPISTLGFAPVLRGVSGGTLSGDPTFTGPSASLPALSGWVPISTTFIDLLKVGAYGLGFEASTGGNNRFHGTQADAQAFALRITWEG